MKIISLFILFFSIGILKAESIDIKLLTFNTMCEFCHKHDDDKFEARKQTIRDIIRDSKADIISLQEVTRTDHINYFFKDLNYELFFYQNYFISYPDTVIAIKKDKFSLLEKSHYWLGDNRGDFSFGWKIALPRILLQVKIKHKESKQVFTVLGSHFDNRVENLIGAAKVVASIAEKKDHVIFLADTNSTKKMESYKILTSELKDLASNLNGSRDLCYLRKGKRFPECRVDHIMSNISQIESKNYQVLLTKNGERFPSDHRPILTEVSIFFSQPSSSSESH